MPDQDELLKRIEGVETGLAVQAATTAGAEATQAATQAGMTATAAATQAGNIATMIAAAAGFFAGIALGMAIAQKR